MESMRGRTARGTSRIGYSGQASYPAPGHHQTTYRFTALSGVLVRGIAFRILRAAGKTSASIALQPATPSQTRGRRASHLNVIDETTRLTQLIEHREHASTLEPPRVRTSCRNRSKTFHGPVSMLSMTVMCHTAKDVSANANAFGSRFSDRNVISVRLVGSSGIKERRAHNRPAL
jgi:hypothetical protein